MTLDFRLLGTVEAHIGGRGMDLGPVSQRCVLVALLVDANHVVSVDQLMNRVWGDSSWHRSTLYSYVSRLRALLAKADEVEIVRRSGGYLITVDPMAVDLHRFRHLVGLARETDDVERAAALCEQGLALWRGEAFEGMETSWLNQVRDVLRAERRAAELDRNELMLRLGRHTDLLADLTVSAQDHPLDERLARQLMLALHWAGRRADALRVFHNTRTALVGELGLDPGPELQTLHQRILADDLDIAGWRPGDPAQRTVVPRQLPADIAHFVGREGDLAELRVHLERSQQAGSSAVVITAVNGTAGVGKTALAVHFGQQVAGEFPDGQLYLDLRGYAPTSPMTPFEALGRLLRGLGLPTERLSEDEEELAVSYRSALAGKRVLIVLDNAQREEQVRPLLPGTPGCLVVITSRAVLSTLDNVNHLHLDVLSGQEALALLARLAGPDRVVEDPEAASAVVRMCARLPLAVRIAGARLVARPTWRVATLAARLADEQRRLDELRVGDWAVRSGFAVSYRALSTSEDPVDRAAARMFRLLGVLDWVDMGVPIAAALLDADHAEAQDALECLVDDHLLDSPSPSRYQTHDLLRLYARDLAIRDESEHDRQLALARVMRCYLDAAEQADLLVNPTTRLQSGVSPEQLRSRFVLSTAADATAWMDVEHANLVAANRQAFDMSEGVPALGVRLTVALNRLFDIRGHWRDRILLNGLAADTAHLVGDQFGEGFALKDVAWTYVRLGRSEQAITMAERALAVWRELGDQRSEQACLNIVGFALRQLDRLAEAIDCLDEAYTICRKIGHRYGEAATQNHRGLVYQRLHRFAEAIECHDQALLINCELNDRCAQATSLANLGWAYQRAGVPDKAIACYQQSVVLARDTGDRYQEAETLWGLGQTHHALGNHDQALACWHRSIVILNDIAAISDEQATVLRGQPIPATPEIILHST